MSQTDYAAWKINNHSRNHADYLHDLAEAWKIFKDNVAIPDGMPIAEQRNVFTMWHLSYNMEGNRRFIPH